MVSYLLQHWLWAGGVAVLMVPARAQENVWRLPPLGAAEYRREWRATASDAARSAAAARELAANGKVPERWLPRLAPAPWVCDGELRPDRRGLGGDVRDLRDLLRALACELGRGGARTFPRLLPFGDVTVTGSWSASADGAQTLVATLSSRAPATAAGEPRGTAERLRAFCVADLQARVEIERRVDVEFGVRGFRAALDGVVEQGPKEFRRFVLEDRWEFIAVRDNQDTDFRVRVGAAIDAGVRFVRDAIDERRSFLVESGGGERNFGSGRLALGLLTLVHGNVRDDDAVLARGFDELRRRRIDDTYSLAAALMAVAARHGRGHPFGGRDADAARKWLKQLLENVDPRGEAAAVLRFNYVAGPRYDTSLQQYGLLGLWSAHCCGLEVPAGAFAAAAKHLLAVQAAPGPRLPLRLTTYASQREAAGIEEPPRADEHRAAARGFAYQEADEPPFGSMTSAGISGLLLARAGMQAAGETDRALLARIDDAVRDGFAWLAADFSVRHNPGFAERADHHWYYWLHGLERSCELAGVALLQGRDWYHEGALQLLSQQQANGSFRAEQSSALLLDATCFAVLFLAKARPAAAVTPR